MRTHLEVRRASATSIKRQEEAVVSPVNDEINELSARLEKLGARNTEAAQSTSTSPFSVEIQQAPLPVGFRMPTMVTYEGKTDPLDLLDAFNDQMDLLQVTMLARCKCFVVTLSGTAKKWICQVEPETSTSWGQLSSMFMRQFQGGCKYATPLSHLASIKQGPNETLKAYIKRFNEELTTIHNPQENGVMMAAISGVRPDTPFLDKLQKDECKTLAEFYKRADKIMCLETAERPLRRES